MAVEWTTETLRVSLFSTVAVNLTNADWKAITGQDEPEREQKVVGRRLLAGPFLDGTLTVSATGPRIDCILTPGTPTDPELGYIPSVGPWPVPAEKFLRVTTQWLAAFQAPLIRIAFGSVLLTRCTSLQDAYETLLSHVKSLTGDPARMRELMFRINWPVSSKVVDGLTLNRITNWSVLQVYMQLIMEVAAKTTVLDPSQPVPVVRLEMDLNTDAERTVPAIDKPSMRGDRGLVVSLQP